MGFGIHGVSWNQSPKGTKDNCVSPPTLLFYFKIVLAITDLLRFYINFRISLSIYIFLKPAGIFTESAFIL